MHTEVLFVVGRELRKFGSQLVQSGSEIAETVLAAGVCDEYSGASRELIRPNGHKDAFKGAVLRIVNAAEDGSRDLLSRQARGQHGGGQYAKNANES